MASARLFRFLVADGHPLFRDALKQIVAARYPGSKIGEAGTFDEVVSCLSTSAETDLVLLDLALPGARGFSGLMFLRGEHPAVPVVVVSASDDPATIRHTIGFGASGYIPKSLTKETIDAAIAAILDGDVWLPPDVTLDQPDDRDLFARLVTLTPQQVRVLMMLSKGLLNKQIAHELSVSEATVKAHVSAILQKLGVDSRTKAVIAASNIDAGMWPSAED